MSVVKKLAVQSVVLPEYDNPAFPDAEIHQNLHEQLNLLYRQRKEESMKQPKEVMTDVGMVPIEQVFGVGPDPKKWGFREEAVKAYGGNSSYFSTWYQKHDIPTIGHRNNKRWDLEAIEKVKAAQNQGVAA
jgi:hypothetical protein